MSKKQAKQQKKEKNAPKKSLKDIFMPDITAVTGSNIELLGNREAIIEGCKGILEYDENTIRLNLGKLSVKFSGIDLCLKCMNTENVIVEGNITSIEFI